MAEQLKCSLCGADANIVRGSYEFDCGLDVVLQGIELVHCTACDNADPIIPQMGGLMCSIALAVVEKPYGMTGRELRFLRTYMGATGVELSQLLGIDKTTLSKWENGKQLIGEQSDRLIRSITTSLSDALEAHTKQVVQNFASIEKAPKSVRYEFEGFDSGEPLTHRYA